MDTDTAMVTVTMVVRLVRRDPRVDMVDTQATVMPSQELLVSPVFQVSPVFPLFQELQVSLFLTQEVTTEARDPRDPRAGTDMATATFQVSLVYQESQVYPAFQVLVVLATNTPAVLEDVV